MRLRLGHVRRDGGTQPRAQMDDAAVAEYAQAYREKAHMPAPVVFHDGESYWLADGFHRFAAAEEAGRKTLEVDLRQGTRRDAVLHSVGANATHGLKRSSEDKRRAVRTLLEDDEWSARSDRWIAKHAAVSHPFVARMRRDGAAEGTGNVSGTRLGQNGKSYPSPTPRVVLDGDPGPPDELPTFDFDDAPAKPEETPRPRKWREVLELPGGAFEARIAVDAHTRLSRAADDDERAELDRSLELALSQWNTLDREADIMVEVADLPGEARVLEPSAGTGAVVRAVLRAHPDARVTACDIDPRRVSSLRAEGACELVLEGDFLEMDIHYPGGWDAVIQNPPYENGADGRFLEHAMELPVRTIVGFLRINVLTGRDRARRVWSKLPGSEELLADLFEDDPETLAERIEADPEWALTEVHIFVGRPGFDGPGEDSARSDYVIVRLDRIFDGEQRPTIVRWRR